MSYIYETPPEDYFFGLTSVLSCIDDIDETNSTGDGKRLLLLVMSATYQFAKLTSWEGDIGGLYFFGLPDPEEASACCGIVLKQSNNGTTFIYSPVALPWLNKYKK